MRIVGYMRTNELLTTAPVEAGDSTNILPEFGRTADVTRLFGLRRGTLYNLLNDGKIKGVSLRVRGHKTGCRLWDLHSVRTLIRSQAESAQREAAAA